MPTACSRRTARRGNVCPTSLIHTNPACTAHRGAVRDRKIVCPDRGGEAVFDRVHFVEHFAFVPPFEDRKHRSENLFTRDTHRGGTSANTVGSMKRPLAQRRIGRAGAAADQPRAFLLGGFDEPSMRSYCTLEMIAPIVVAAIGGDAGLVMLDPGPSLFQSPRRGFSRE